MVSYTLAAAALCFLALLTLLFRSRLSMPLESLALRHQLAVYPR